MPSASARPTDVLTQIQRHNAGRDPERLALKYRAMRQNAFAFMRGSCHLFVALLPQMTAAHTGPAVWACGDLHLENFGSYQGDNRLAYFDINDFDESALAPASWDLLRLLTSLLVGGDSLAWPQADALARCSHMLDSYAQALSAGKAFWLERESATGQVRQLLDSLRERKRVDFLNSRTTVKRGVRHLDVDGKRALPASADDQAAVLAFMADFARGQPQPEAWRVLDVARRIAGTGSLGLPRFVILVAGKGTPDGQRILDLKLAPPSSLLPHLPVVQPPWSSEAERIVAVQRRMQAMPMACLHAVHLAGQPFVLRALQPSEDRLTLSSSARSPAELDLAAVTLGQLLAWAQLRSSGRQGSANADALIAFGQSTDWRAPLLTAARELARLVERDAAQFAQAHDDGHFRV